MRTMGDVRDDALRLVKIGIICIVEGRDDRKGSDYIRAAAALFGDVGVASDGGPLWVDKRLHDALLELSQAVLWPAASKAATTEAHDKMTRNL